MIWEKSLLAALKKLRFAQNKSVGYYEDELEAAREYDKAVLELRGPNAKLNLPQEVQRKSPSDQGPIQLPSSTEEEIALAVKTIVAAYEAGMHNTSRKLPITLKRILL